MKGISCGWDVNKISVFCGLKNEAEVGGTRRHPLPLVVGHAASGGGGVTS